jgi:hypothetical protein
MTPNNMTSKNAGTARLTEAVTRERIAGFLIGVGVGTAVGYFLMPLERNGRPATRPLAPSEEGRPSTTQAPSPNTFSEEQADPTLHSIVAF